MRYNPKQKSHTTVINRFCLSPIRTQTTRLHLSKCLLFLIAIGIVLAFFLYLRTKIFYIPIVLHPQSIREQWNSSFATIFLRFPWSEYQKAAEQEDQERLNYYTSMLINELSEFIALEPKVPINATCTTPLLIDPSLIQCSNYPSAFSGKKGINLQKLHT